MKNKYKKEYKRKYKYEMGYQSGYERGSIKALDKMITTALILAFIATQIFDLNIWIISNLSIIQFIFIIVALKFIFKGLRYMSGQDYSHYNSEEEKWQRWNMNSHDYNQSPPPPPPNNQSFSGYNPYEQENEYTKQQTYHEQENEYTKQQAYHEQENEYTKQQTYHDQYNGYQQFNREPLQYNTFIGDFKYEESYTQLRPIMFNAFIGDARIDLSRVEVPPGETVIQMSCFIGDMKVHMPNDPRIGVKINVSSFIGDGRLFEQKRSGIGGNVALLTPNYYECDRRVSVELNSFIGDLKVKRVG